MPWTVTERKEEEETEREKEKRDRGASPSQELGDLCKDRSPKHTQRPQPLLTILINLTLILKQRIATII